MIDNKDIINRIILYAEYKKISIWGLEKQSELTRGVIGNAIKNNGVIGSDKLAKIVTHNEEINPIWLLTGKGEMILLANIVETENTENLDNNTHSIKIAEFVEKVKGLEMVIQTQKDEIAFLRKQVDKSS